MSDSESIGYGIPLNYFYGFKAGGGDGDLNVSTNTAISSSLFQG